MNTPANTHVENILLTVSLQLILIIAASRMFGALFRRMGQPQVCGEIAAGLVLGPSLLGGLFPGLFTRIFDPSAGVTLSVLSQLGLVLLMFLIGLEFDFRHLGENPATAISVSIAGIVLPFGLGVALGKVMHDQLHLAGDWIHFTLFMGTAMSITAIPVLGRIMIELNINRTRIGSLTIAAAAIDDAAGWILVALSTAVVRSEFDPAKLSLMIAEVIGFGVVMILVVRPVLIRWTRHIMRGADGELSLNGLALLLILVLLAAAATNLIGIFSIFGGFFLGAILHDQQDFARAVKGRLNDFVTVFFLPIFFTYTGLRTDVGTMAGAEMWIFCGLLSLTAIAGKFGGCALAARVNGLPWREASIMGVLMNTRGMMGMVVINIGLDLGIINKSVFFMLVLMAVFTTLMTVPVVRRLASKSEIEAAYLKSVFVR